MSGITYSYISLDRDFLLSIDRRIFRSEVNDDDDDDDGKTHKLKS